MRSLPVLGLILTGLMASGLGEAFSPLVRFSIVFLLFTFVLGEVLRSRLGVNLPLPTATVSMILGLSVMAVVAWLCTLAGLSFTACSAVLQFFLAVVFIAALFRRAAGESNPWSTTRTVLWLAVAVGVFFLLFPPLTDHRGDGYDHIGYVRKIMEEDDLAPAGVLAPVGTEADTKLADPRKGAFHVLLASTCRIAHVDPALAWRWLPAFLAPLAVLTFWSFCLLLLPGYSYAAACMLLFMMFQGGLAREFLSTIAYGQHVALVYFWFLLVAAVHYGRQPSPQRLFVVLVVLLGGGVIHLDVLVHFGLAVASLLLFPKVFDMRAAASVRLAAGAVACAAAVVVWKLMAAYAPGNMMHLHPQGLLYVTDRWYVPSPIELLKRYGLLFVAALPLIAFLPLVRRHRRFALMMLALAAPPVVIAANPFLVPLIYERAGYIVHRFLLNIPVLPVTVLVLGSMVGWARSRGWPARGVTAIVLFAWGRLFLMSATAWAADVRSTPVERREPPGALMRIATHLNEETEKGSVLLSDAVTSYAMSAYTHNRVVGVLHQHGSPNDPWGFERLEDMNNVLSPYTTQIEAMSVMRRYDVEYVLVHGAGPPVREFMAEWYPETAGVLAQKLGSLRGVFRLVYNEDGYMLFRVGGAEPERETWAPTVPFMMSAPDDAMRCAGASATMQPRVKALRVEPVPAVPGEKIRVTISYQRDSAIESPLPLLLYIRLEDTSYFERTARYFGDKIVRRARERRSGAFVRYRFDHRPFGGVYAPDMWPLGVEVTESVTLQLPVALADTEYALQVKLTHETLIPNFSIRDIFYNDDHYTGYSCGEVPIAGRE